MSDTKILNNQQIASEYNKKAKKINKRKVRVLSGAEV
ncbi:MAG: hypothetical protein ACJA1Z_000827 [Patiriisocius sp.]|jgi:hypothetical protein